ncbi:MAG TPA: AsmA family protein, partial [Gemmatimonadaceae bacterium]|nr:AsmA family protein [Gemmatimonadaceae bacterium]
MCRGGHAQHAIFTEFRTTGYRFGRVRTWRSTSGRMRLHAIESGARLAGVIPVRALKIIALLLGGLVALIAITLIAVRLFVDPNDYKARIATEVRKATGRELTLAGKIKLTVFPWIALELGPATLGNPPGFGAEPFATVQHAAVRVRLVPLLRKRLQIGRIEVDGLDLRLVRRADGKGNWQDFGARESTAPRSPPASYAAIPELAGIAVANSRISYQGIVAD